MILGTTYVLPDEPAINLAEVNLMAPTGVESDTALYRFQILIIMRDGDPTEYRERLGLACDFKANQFRIMGGMLDGDELFVEETVGTLKEMADQMRDESPEEKLAQAMEHRPRDKR